MIIAVISTQRSGTKLLGNCFQMGTVVTPFGEVFNPDVPQIGSFSEFMKARGPRMAARGNSAVLDDFFSQFAHVCSVYAVDVMFNQLEIPCVSWNDRQIPFALYGYLRDVLAIIVSLVRNPFDSFVSMKHLHFAGGSAHHGSGDGIVALKTVLQLDENEFLAYRDHVSWHREVLGRSMSGYEFFYELSYRDLANGGVPESLRALIKKGASVRGMNIDPDRIQMLPPTMRPSNVAYESTFENFDALLRRHGSGDPDVQPSNKQ